MGLGGAWDDDAARGVGHLGRRGWLAGGEGGVSAFGTRRRQAVEAGLVHCHQRRLKLAVDGQLPVEPVGVDRLERAAVSNPRG